MKNIFIFTLLILNSAFVFGQNAEFSFYKKTKNYHVINEGDTLKGFFVFKNTGTDSLKIKDYTVECHCTQAFFPKTPTPPNATDTVYFTFDSNGKSFQQKRTILIYANTKDESAIVTFKVYVNPKEAFSEKKR